MKDLEKKTEPIGKEERPIEGPVKRYASPTLVKPGRLSLIAAAGAVSAGVL